MTLLTELCAPIASDLERTTAILRRELAGDLDCVNDMCRHVAGFHGKMLRPSVLLLSGRCFGPARPEHYTLAAVVELVHIATLVHDDILDESELRRGEQTVNRRWNNERAVLFGDYLISHAFHLCSSLDSQAASRAIGRTTNTVCEGEIMQVANRGNLDLTEEQYFEIIYRKTASLIETCCGLGARYAAADDDAVARLEKYGRSVGIAFQIADDVLDLVGDERETGKSLGRDAEKGKLTLPVIHHLRRCSTDERAAAVEWLHSADPAARRRLVDRLNHTESIEFARDAAQTHIRAAIDALSPLPESDARDTLRAMADFVLARRQ